MDSSDQIVKSELFNPALEFTPGLGGFPAQPKIQGQLPTKAVVVLEIHAKKCVAVLLKLSCSLAEGEVAAVIAELAGQEVGNAAKTKLGWLKELIVQIHLATFKHEAEFQIVLSLDPTDVVSKCYVVADEACLGIVAKAEEAVYPDLLNRFLRCLERKVYAEVLNTLGVVCRPSGCVFRRVAKAKIVYQRRPDNVCPVAQVVLGLNR